MPNNARMVEGLPDEVRAALRVAGDNIRIARTRRRESEEAFAARLMVSPPTLRKLERGDPTVSTGLLFSALWALGMLSDATALAEPDRDEVGKTTARRLPPLRGRARRTESLDVENF